MSDEYARNTKVSVERSKAEIEKLLRKFGAKKFGTMEDIDAGIAYLMFEHEGLSFQIPVRMPFRKDYTMSPARRVRTAAAATEAWDQAIKARWRVVFLLTKAKLIAIDQEHSTIEREFLSDVMLPRPDGPSSVGDIMIPELRKAASTGQLPKLLPGPKS